VWRGAIDWEVTEFGSMPWRVDRFSAEYAVRDALAEVAKSAAGVRASFESDASSCRMVLERLDDEAGCVDLLIDGALKQRVGVQRGMQSISFALPGVRANIELWLPQAGITRVVSLELEDASFVTAESLNRPRWIAYGSSITQCFEAAGPTGTWPSQVARALRWDLTCMGFSGQCFLDDVVADTISRTPADIITTCVGINIYNRGDWDFRQFVDRLDRFLRIIRRRNSDAPIVVMSPIASPSRETMTNRAGITLTDIRRATASVVDGTDLHGLHYLNGLEVLGLKDQDLLRDGLHPSAAGYLLMSERLRPMLLSKARFTTA
jgi:lysophospholipase L1-like esterase